MGLREINGAGRGKNVNSLPGIRDQKENKNLQDGREGKGRPDPNLWSNQSL